MIPEQQTTWPSEDGPPPASLGSPCAWSRAAIWRSGMKDAGWQARSSPALVRRGLADEKDLPRRQRHRMRLHTALLGCPVPGADAPVVGFRSNRSRRSLAVGAADQIPVALRQLGQPEGAHAAVVSRQRAEGRLLSEWYDRYLEERLLREVEGQPGPIRDGVR